MGESRKPPKLSPSIQNELGKDLRRHEKLLGKRWRIKWGHLMPENSQNLKDYNPESRSADNGAGSVLRAEKCYPRTSAGIVGWKSANGSESLENFSTTRRMPPKIRLLEEIYGVYRSECLAQTTLPEKPKFAWVKQERIAQPILS